MLGKILVSSLAAVFSVFLAAGDLSAGPDVRRGGESILLVVPSNERYADVIRRVCSRPYSPNDVAVTSERSGVGRILDEAERLSRSGPVRVIGPFTAGIAWNVCRALERERSSGGAYRFYFPLLSIEECRGARGVGTFFPLMRMSEVLMEKLVSAGWRRFEIVASGEKVFRVISGMLQEICRDRGLECSVHDADGCRRRR